MIKKIILLILAVFLLASCSHPPVELLDFIGDQDDFVIKYNGHILKMYQDSDPEDVVIVFPYNNSLQSDALLNRIKDI